MPKVVLSTNLNPLYLFFLPITVLVWARMGFESIVILPEDAVDDQLGLLSINAILPELNSNIIFIKPSPEYPVPMQIQTARLYACCCEDIKGSEAIITGDIDMIPLSNYFYRDLDKVNVYGWDLTGFEQVPLCYICATKDKWMEIMGVQGCKESDIVPEMIKEIDKYPTAKSPVFHEYWTIDQQIITAKIKAYKGEVNQIHRGVIPGGGGCAKGRVDRAFGFNMDVADPIDSHLLRPGYTDDNFAKIITLIKKILPSENLSWMYDYRNKFVTELQKS